MKRFNMICPNFGEWDEINFLVEAVYGLSFVLELQSQVRMMQSVSDTGKKSKHFKKSMLDTGNIS
jgi:hypothetical protein